jgi:hypothetical protein
VSPAELFCSFMSSLSSPADDTRSRRDGSPAGAHGGGSVRDRGLHDHGW